jgi:hypothetical protein
MNVNTYELRKTVNIICKLQKYAFPFLFNYHTIVSDNSLHLIISYLGQCEICVIIQFQLS